MVVSRTLHHVRQDALQKEFKLNYVKTVLCATLQKGSSLALLRGNPGVLQSILEFSLPTLDEKEFSFKMGLGMCTGTEHVWMESLVTPDGNRANYASLSNGTLGGARMVLLKPFLRQHASDCNDDGSFLNEGQLRVLWRDFCLPRFCGSSTRCHGKCAALPGDTIYFGITHYGYPVARRYEPATQQDLEERGWLAYGPGGLLVANARVAREDPSQLESDNDDDES